MKMYNDLDSTYFSCFMDKMIILSTALYEK